MFDVSVEWLFFMQVAHVWFLLDVMQKCNISKGLQKYQWFLSSKKQGDNVLGSVCPSACPIVRLSEITIRFVAKPCRDI